MNDYYAILGVSKTASLADIKTAFRALAKQYHPDKNANPSATALFTQILKAYNVLANPHARKRYDYSLVSHATISNNYTQPPKQKQYKERKTVSEEELKGRDYYKTHYKQAEKKAQQQPQQTYSDYKYVLYATPIAVGLLMLVMSMFTDEPAVTKTNSVIISKDSVNTNSQK